MAKRMVEDWVTSYLEYSKELEAPDYYHSWTAISVLSSAVRRNIWIDQGHYLLYPNTYIILIGPQGKIGKSTAIRAGRRLLQAVEEVVIGPDSVTREDLIRQIADIGGPGKQSAIALYSNEFSSLIDPSKEHMIAFLTDIYDCEWNPKGWKYNTKGAGKDTIHNPCVNLLAGTTPSWLGKKLPVDAVESGFTARIIFVYADENRFFNPRPRAPAEKVTYALTEDLKGIATLQGKATLTEPAWVLYEQMYEQVGKSDPPDYRLAGYYWRKAKVHLLKTALLLSISRSDSLVVEEEDLQKTAHV